MRTASFVAALATVVCLAACSSPAPVKVAPVSGTVAQAMVTTNARVERIDHATRHVLLRDAAGKGIEMKVPDDVRNLSEVQVGDEVVVSYQESLAYEVKKPGMAQPGMSGGLVRRTDDGELSNARVSQSVTATVVVESIDMDRPSVTLRSTDGKVVTVPVKDREKLRRVAVGDLVEITYTEALMAAVQPRR